MLETLVGRDESEITALLVSATDSLLPHPTERETAPEHSDILESLLREVDQTAKVSRSDMTPPALAARFEILLREFTNRASSTQRTARARSRLGQRGDLPPTSYRIEFPPAFREIAAHGIRRAHVEAALLSPDQVQHLLPEIEKAEAISLYTRVHINPARPLDVSTLLVQTTRILDVQRVDSAWLVFHAEVDISKAREPLDILRAFVDVYGLEFSVPSGPGKTKFLLYHKLAPKPEERDRMVLKVEHAPDAHFKATHLMRLGSDGAIEVAIAYTIDLARYLEDLRRHNVQVKT